MAGDRCPRISGGTFHTERRHHCRRQSGARLLFDQRPQLALLNHHQALRDNSTMIRTAPQTRARRRPSRATSKVDPGGDASSRWLSRTRLPLKGAPAGASASFAGCCQICCQIGFFGSFCVCGFGSKSLNLLAPRAGGFEPSTNRLTAVGLPPSSEDKIQRQSRACAWNSTAPSQISQALAPAHISLDILCIAQNSGIVRTDRRGRHVVASFCCASRDRSLRVGSHRSGDLVLGN